MTTLLLALLIILSNLYAIKSFQIPSNLNARLYSRKSFRKRTVEPTYDARSAKQVVRRGRSNSALALFEDDLPNILGINPLEAAIIFGGLYYFFGPVKLYELTREAGKLFATYVPIVQQATMDVFNEFRDYFEEDSEREKLRKIGVDVDKIPRRTTNIIERFQQSMELINTTMQENETKLNGARAPASPLNVVDDEENEEEVEKEENSNEDLGNLSESERLALKRRSKKKILTKRGILKNTSTESSNLVDANATANTIVTAPQNPDYDQILAALDEEESNRKLNQANKFQMQISGRWNEQIMMQTSNLMINQTENTPSTTEISNNPLEQPIYSNQNEIDQRVVRDTAVDHLPISASFVNIEEPIENIPAELSIDDNNDDISADVDIQAGQELLRELDRDYMALRRRLVTFLERREARKVDEDKQSVN